MATTMRTRAGGNVPFPGPLSWSLQEFPGPVSKDSLLLIICYPIWPGRELALSRGPLSLTWRERAPPGSLRSQGRTTSQRLEGTSPFRGPLAKQGRELRWPSPAGVGRDMPFPGVSPHFKMAGSPSTIANTETWDMLVPRTSTPIG